MVTKSGGSSSQSKSGSSAAGKTANKSGSKSGSSSSGGGFWGGVKDFFGGFGSGSSSSGPTSANRPQARPDVLVSGTGKDRQYIDTRTGQRYNEPSYGAFSPKGLTSTDPANVMRNRAAADMYARQDAARAAAGYGSEGGGTTDIAPAAPAPPPPPRMTREQLAALGASTAPLGPVEVATPVYGIPSALQPFSYGSAFMAQPASIPNYFNNFYGSMQGMDIFDPRTFMLRYP